MSQHIFANFITPYGTASNNRGETDGNITTLQKLVWQGRVHTTVSAESIRFALRLQLNQAGQNVNRSWNDDTRKNQWEDPSFADWARFIDDDLLGFMSAEAAKEEAEDSDAEADVEAASTGPAKKKAKSKGTATVRRSPLEITRAVSLTPWPGDTTFNAASPVATPSAAKKGTDNPVPYGAEMHSTRYQYGIALTPGRLKDPARTAIALQGLINLRKVAGNHGRFLFDFAPDSLVLRITSDPAPRLLYCFDSQDDGRTVGAAALIEKIQAEDIDPQELYIGGSIANTACGKALTELKANVYPGVKAALASALTKIG